MSVITSLSLLIVLEYDDKVEEWFSNDNKIRFKMEVPSQEQEGGVSRSTYRTVKPPDQCVISYNFQHAESVNFTHNLLIGMGMQSTLKSHRKPDAANTPPDKQKLFSIITQPKKVFRNQAHSVNKAYNNILPKRHQPQKIKKNNKKQGNNSHHQAMKRSEVQHSKERIGQKEGSAQLQQQAQGKHQNSFKDEKGVRQEGYILNDVINSPYGPGYRYKSHKPKLHNNLNIKRNQNYSPNKQNSHPQQHSNTYLNAHSNMSSNHQEPSRQPHSSIYLPKQKKQILNTSKKLEHSNEKSNKSRSQFSHSKLASNKQLNRNKISGSNHKGQLSPKRQLINSKGQLMDSKKQLNQSKAELNQSFKDSPSTKKLVSTHKSFKHESQKSNMANRRSISPQHKDPSLLHTKPQNSSINYSSPSKAKPALKNNQPIAKGRKQIQDQQLHQLQMRVRREESSKFKKGNFKISSNKEREILPFQASIEPLFTSSKPSFSKNNNKPGQPTKNGRGTQPNNSFKKTSQSLLKDPKQNRQNDRISKQIEINKSKNDASLPTKNKLDASKLQATSLPKNTSHNATTMIPSQKIKRNNLQKSQFNPKDSEDLTLNNQIKGFKVVTKVVSPKIPKVQIKPNQITNNGNKQGQNTTQENNKKSFIRANPINDSTSLNVDNGKAKDREEQMTTKHRYSQASEQQKGGSTFKKRPNQSMALPATNQAQKDKNRKTANISSKGTQKQKSQSIDVRSDQANTPIKPTFPRRPNDKDSKIKKWKESELEQVERLRRDSKRKSQASPSVQKESNSTKRNSKFNNKNKTKQIDLDEQQEDQFGLRTKRKSNSTNKSKLAHNKKKKQVLLNEGESNGQMVMDDSMEQISSIHSSKITELQQQASEKVIASHNNNLYSQPTDVDLEELIIATEQHPNLNSIQAPIKNEQGAVLTQARADFINDDAFNDEGFKQQIIEQNSQPPINQQSNEQVNIKQQRQLYQQGVQQNQTLQAKQINSVNNNKQQTILIPQSIPTPSFQQLNSNNPNHNNQKILQNHNRPMTPTRTQQINDNIHQQVSKAQRAHSPNENNISLNNEDLFEYNIKELSKFNETVNQTFNMTKYQFFERDINQYIRAPITTFIYGSSQKNKDQIASFNPSAKKVQIFTEQPESSSPQFEMINKAINILLSIDQWIIKRIFEPYLSEQNQIGVWLYYQGFWKVYPVQNTTDFRFALRKALEALVSDYHLEQQLQLQAVLRIISGVRVAKLKSTKKRVFSELDYSLKKKHVLKAVTSKDSKWGERLFEVVKVQTSVQGGNVLQIKQKSDFFWVRQQKFKEIFQHFILICTRPSHFWTNKFVANQESHKSVLSFSSDVVTHGSITLYYPSEQKSSLYLYKELQSKVLKFMGSLEQKANQNGNIYFQFRVHGTYYLFLQTPADCQMAIESTSKLLIGEPEYIVSHTLKNQKCEYVQIQKVKQGKGGKQGQSLVKLREQFINMISSK